MARQKNFRKAPARILTKLDKIDSQQVVVGCLRGFTANEIKEGRLSHLGVELSDDGLVFEPEVLPNPAQGRHSNWNTNGREIVRDDLPKETLYHDVDAPNWRGSGTHTVSLPHERYPREFVAPRNTTIQIECVDSSPGQDAYQLKFQLTEALDRDAQDFSDRLFDCLNLMQENVGSCGIEAADVSIDDYVATLNVSWEILPPGTVDEAIARVFAGRHPTEQESSIVADRFDFFMSLNPEKLVFGNSGFQRYFGAMLQSDLVVFENVRSGNAIYVMFDDWEELCQASRVDLLSGLYGDGFERVVHSGNWQDRVRAIIHERLAE